MKELLNRLIALHKSGEKMQETTLLKTNEQNVTPEWIDTLKKNEIFVFGCRNSGRHFDGASNFALEMDEQGHLATVSITGGSMKLGD